MIALKALAVFKVSDKLNWVDPTYTVTPVVRPRRRVPEALIGVSQGTLEVVTWFSCLTGNLNGARQLTGSTPLFVSLRVILHYGFVYTLRIWLWIGPTRSLTISHHPWGYVAWARWYKMFPNPCYRFRSSYWIIKLYEERSLCSTFNSLFFFAFKVQVCAFSIWPNLCPRYFPGLLTKP